MMVIRTDNFDGVYDGGAQTVRLWCEATVAIAVGDWLAISPTDTSNPGGIVGESYIAADATGTTDNSNLDVVGVATEALASGTGWVTCQVRGHIAAANVDAAVDAGDILCVGTTKGVAVEQVFDAATTANRRSIGRAVTAASSGSAICEIFPHPKFA